MGQIKVLPQIVERMGAEGSSFLMVIIHFTEVGESNPAQQFFSFYRSGVLSFGKYILRRNQHYMEDKRSREKILPLCLSGSSFIVLDTCVSKKGGQKKSLLGPSSPASVKRIICTLCF